MLQIDEYFEADVNFLMFGVPPLGELFAFDYKENHSVHNHFNNSLRFKFPLIEVSLCKFCTLILLQHKCTMLYCIINYIACLSLNKNIMSMSFKSVSINPDISVENKLEGTASE